MQKCEGRVNLLLTSMKMLSGINANELDSHKSSLSSITTESYIEHAGSLTSQLTTLTPTNSLGFSQDEAHNNGLLLNNTISAWLELQEDNVTAFPVNSTEVPYTPYEYRPETYIIPIIFAIIFIVGVLGNGTLVIVFLRHRTMRNVPNT